MTPDHARQLIEITLLDIVPDADLATLRPDADIREHLELDSLDFLEFVERLSKRAGCRIDESDYAALRTMEEAVGFITVHSVDSPG